MFMNKFAKTMTKKGLRGTFDHSYYAAGQGKTLHQENQTRAL
jgi:hypothetical protein